MGRYRSRYLSAVPDLSFACPKPSSAFVSGIVEGGFSLELFPREAARNGHRNRCSIRYNVRLSHFCGHRQNGFGDKLSMINSDYVRDFSGNCLANGDDLRVEPYSATELRSNIRHPPPEGVITGITNEIDHNSYRDRIEFRFRGWLGYFNRSGPVNERKSPWETRKSTPLRGYPIPLSRAPGF